MEKQFIKAQGKRVAITNEQTKQIKKMYHDILNDLKPRVDYLKTRDSMTSERKLMYLNELVENLEERLESLDKKTETLIKKNMNIVIGEVIKENQEFLKTLGFSQEIAKVAYSHIPQDVINEIITGKLYEGRWSLSKAIWNNNTLKNKELEYIVSKGVAEQKSAFEIAKDLEKYVNPSSAKPWDFRKVYPKLVGNATIDYNAQRLARTMVSQAYQESFVRATIKNPFITYYRWLISNSDRVCPICIERGESDHGYGVGLYKKDELPLDHPNGMCTWSVVTKPLESVSKDIADWAKGEAPEKLSKEIDDFVVDTMQRKSDYF